jgi:hypothetical protein
MTKTIGIITFHAAHNYGAIMQAHSLQQVILSLGFDCKIIDFRTPAQIDFSSYKTKRNGIKSMVKNFLLLPYKAQYRLRSEKLERFINNSLLLTERFSSERELEVCANSFDAFITGSDQVWNTLKKADTSPAYFLSFVSEEKKKISYAVSVGNAAAEDLLQVKEYIERFDAISVREMRGVQIIHELLGLESELVLDPTLLVNAECLVKLANERQTRFHDYIFYYSLDGYDKRKQNVDILTELSEKTGKKIIALTPEWPKRVVGIENVIDVGIEDFLSLINYADLICTNSFHGTALSIALNKNFLVLEKFKQEDDRKTTILKLLGLEHRMIDSVSAIGEAFNPIDYNAVNLQLEELKKHSLSFLKKAID